MSRKPQRSVSFSLLIYCSHAPLLYFSLKRKIGVTRFELATSWSRSIKFYLTVVFGRWQKHRGFRVFWSSRPIRTGYTKAEKLDTGRPLNSPTRVRSGAAVRLDTGDTSRRRNRFTLETKKPANVAGWKSTCVVNRRLTACLVSSG